MYAANARGGAEDEAAVTARIRELVFTYLNAVQLLYQSDLLANKLRLVLVRSPIGPQRVTCPYSFLIGPGAAGDHDLAAGRPQHRWRGH